MKEHQIQHMPPLDRKILSSDDNESMGDIFRDWNEAKKQRKRDNFEAFKSEDHLKQVEQATGLTIVRKSEYHYHILNVQGYLVNWWPSSHRWQWQRDNRVHHGPLSAMINYLNKRKGSTKGTEHGNAGSDSPAQQEPQDVQTGGGDAGEAPAKDHVQAADDDRSPPW